MSYLTHLIERLGQALRPAKAASAPPEPPVSIHEPVQAAVEQPPLHEPVPAPVEQPPLHEPAPAPVEEPSLHGVGPIEDSPEEPALAEAPGGTNDQR